MFGDDTEGRLELACSAKDGDGFVEKHFGDGPHLIHTNQDISPDFSMHP